ncbi:sterol desaturase family protein [Beijerinckia sp. L45]|uniref:sterol desaturase family protein n=1 Tax=Beijerinckia sp. L45 TaxID=1641855 RepID=UPI00131D20F1|nr:sterol desaturase family protein [Beijerinckia sp. L45]
MIPMPSWLPALVRRTRREYFADFWITPPITAALAVYSLSRGFDWWWAIAFVAGWFAWTLYEYAVHRISHHAPWISDLHWLHHRNQKDYIALHPALTLLNYAVIWLLFGFDAAPFAIGFSVGYVVYAGLHTAFHYAWIKDGELLWPLKQHHVAHHRYHDRCFGVSTKLWDRVFRTI